MTEKTKRFDVNIKTGLTKDQVEERIKQGLTNIDKTIPTKTISQIIKDNTFTLFNLINVVLALALIYVGSYKNLMFMGVIICNSIIGIIQEIRSKIAIDKLGLISCNTITVIRDSEKIKIPKEDLVLDDIVCYFSGDQVVSDCTVVEGSCEVNESLLTGEPNLITKKVGDTLLSGSFIVSSVDCTAKVEKVGSENYVSKILSKTKYIKTTKSEIMETVNKIVKFISIVIVPIGCILFYRQFKIYNYNLEPVVVSVSSALIGMIPEGLVLLISTILAVGIIRLAKHKVLVQDLYCIETLARVDTMFLDKTGTITEGTFEVKDLIPKNEFSEDEVKQALKCINNNLEKLMSKLKDTIIIITADHGAVDIEEIYLNEYKEIDDCLLRPPSIDSRFVSFFIKEDKKEIFKELITKYFKDNFLIYEKDEFLKLNLLGYGKKHERIDDYFGDFILIGNGNLNIRYTTTSIKSKSLKADHSGITKEEMQVPVIVIKSKK